MFSDGPYNMGIMKSAAPEMAGQWKVALHPYGKQPGSYLGGTGLVIPAAVETKRGCLEVHRICHAALKTRSASTPMPARPRR